MTLPKQKQTGEILRVYLEPPEDHMAQGEVPYRPETLVYGREFHWTPKNCQEQDVKLRVEKQIEGEFFRLEQDEVLRP